MSFSNSINHSGPAGKKKLAALIDPDKQTLKNWETLTGAYEESADLLLFGGSHISEYRTAQLIQAARAKFTKPIILFPGNALQIEPSADAIWLLSLVSGRNPEYLIGQHVNAAPILKKSGLDIVSTAYILIDGGSRTSVEYITQSIPVPANKPELAVATAMAAEMLGMKQLYLEAGSGAKNRVSDEIIKAVRENTTIPLIVGGGIRDAETLYQVCKAGADIVVTGNILEKHPERIHEFSAALKQASVCH